MYTGQEVNMYTGQEVNMYTGQEVNMHTGQEVNIGIGLNGYLIAQHAYRTGSQHWYWSEWISHSLTCIQDRKSTLALV
jgi:hypothetical protein